MREFDFLVVGGGIAGLSAAARLARHGSTLVCETESALGVHASGRSAAFAHFDMETLVVRALTAASMPLFQEPGARVHPALFVALEGQDEALDRLEAHYREWAPGVERLDGERARALVPVFRDGSVCGALLHRDARKLDAHAMLETHRKALVADGGEVALYTPVTGLTHENGRWQVATPDEQFSTKIVLNAAGAWADRIAELAGVAPLGLTPMRRTVITFDVDPRLGVSRWPFAKTVGEGFYMEAEGSARLLACPMDESASAPCDAQPEEEDVALAAWRIEQATTLKIPHLAAKWAGLRTFAPDRNPIVGFDQKVPGFIWLAGQGGFGLQTSAALALAVEALATGGDWPGELRAVGVTREALSPTRFD